MQETINYNLKKPEANDNVNIDDLNFNFDIIDEKLFAVIQAWENFKANGGEIGGVIKGKEGTDGHRLFEHIGVFNNRNAKIKTGSVNYNGYPSWSYIVDDIDDDTNSNGIVYLLGTGKSGDAYKDNYLSPWKQGYNSGKNNLGSAAVSWNDIWLVGRQLSANGYNKLPNGMLLQWGIVAVESGEITAVTLPMTFPNGIIGSWASIRDTPGSGECGVASIEKNTSTIVITHRNGITRNIRYFAIGY